MKDAVDELDRTVKHIRSAIFGLETRVGQARTDVRNRVLDVVLEAGPKLGFEPTLLFEGPVDTATSEPVATDLLATLQAALSNVARHAAARRVDVIVAIDRADDSTELVLRVSDDGVGATAEDRRRGHGLDDMAARATRRNGSFAIGPANPHGTVVEWRARVT